MLLPEAQPLCIQMPKLLSERVLDEVEKDSFITLPDKGRHTGFLSPKTVYLYPRGIDEGFYNNDSKLGSLTRLRCEQGLQPLI